ncbi:TonB-dependent receptor plug domain-containing protein [Hymenobacter sp. YC55]|uniref:TonB-dependent receptor n=1 Tax=Hymenobacter sp. YC55 TaxID=3034019 RepID=UPI0023F8A26D|nr:TonB-dependent receptor plug domain-containing protein [Hymenobacter sp. YC55]MDF7815381.1 carboxypeptidase-like regulatory domain-containing protein [Hymenobacter sp. YC55]
MAPFTSVIALSVALVCCATTPARCQDQYTEVSGTVSTANAEPLPMATVLVKGTFIVVQTDNQGVFRLRVPTAQLPSPVAVSFVGYETRVDTLRARGAPLTVVLQPSLTLINEVVVSASRSVENILRTGATVDKLNSVQVERLPTHDLIQGLARQKGVDVTTSGMFNASLSTRGLNSANSERLVQLVDGIDTQSPSLNINPGNSLGLTEVDIDGVEVLHGPSSALYGANAFNGVVLTTSKDPFLYEGLTVRLRGGTRGYTDAQARYAVKLSNRLAFKLTGSYGRGQEWIADNYAALSPEYLPTNNPAGSLLGYDAVNRYGDVGNTFGPTGGALNGKTVFMPGWTEREIVAGDRTAQLYRIFPSLHFLLTDKIKVLAEYKRASGTTGYQATNRYRLKNFGFNQYRVEVRSDKWFVRAYQTRDGGNDSYDLSFSGAFMNASADPRSGAANLSYAQQYFTAYARAYNTYLTQNPGDIDGAGAAGQAAGAPFQLQAGSPEFATLRQQVITDPTPGVGSQLNPGSNLTDFSGQYEFRLLSLQAIAGAAYRRFRLSSDGRLFADRDGQPIRYAEYGAYLQLSQLLLAEKLKLTLAGRLDGSRNFANEFSPRASAVYSVGAERQHNFRVSYNEAYRYATQLGQYLYLDLSRVLLLGNISSGFSGYSTAVTGQLGTILRAGNGAPALLAPYEVNADRLKVERVKAFEIGYKGLLLTGLTVDLDYYLSRFNNFISQVRLLTNLDGSRPTLAQLATASASMAPFQTPDQATRVIQVQANARQEVRASGYEVGFAYTPTKAIEVSGNYTLSLLDRKGLPADFQTSYNTPKHKFNAGVAGELKKVYTYSLNYRWAQGHRFESPFAAGDLGTYSSLDAKLGYRLPRLHTELVLGGTNLGNARNVQVYGGPQVGRLVFLGVTLDFK